MIRRIIAGALTGLLVASLSTAAAADQRRTTRVGPTNNPNQVLCRSQQEIGSRLRANRVCRTRVEWDEYDRQTRRAVETAQGAQSHQIDPEHPRAVPQY